MYAELQVELEKSKSFTIFQNVFFTKKEDFHQHCIFDRNFDFPSKISFFSKICILTKLKNLINSHLGSYRFGEKVHARRNSPKITPIL